MSGFTTYLNVASGFCKSEPSIAPSLLALHFLPVQYLGWSRCWLFSTEMNSADLNLSLNVISGNSRITLDVDSTKNERNVTPPSAIWLHISSGFRSCFLLIRDVRLPLIVVECIVQIENNLHAFGTFIECHFQAIPCCKHDLGRSCSNPPRSTTKYDTS
jgi:hypothetical protein